MTNQAALDDFLDFLRFASVSTDPAYAPQVSACADWLVAKLNRIGLKAERRETPGHPIVVARNERRPDRPTVMIYGHYDVQPVDPLNLWDSPPFEPRIERDVVYARGATDNKGQIFAHILGVEAALAEHGDLPVNVIFLIEGEEEVGSKHLGDFLAANADDFRCDVVAVSDTGMVGRGRPTFTYGLRGIAAMELLVTGPSMDLHSGVYGGAVANPATAVARLAASLHDADGKVTIPGFYDGVKDIQAWEREAWAKLPVNDEEMLANTGVPALVGEAGYSSVERCYARPTAEVNGIGGGYQGEGTKTIIPAKAFAKLTFRLVPGQDPAHVLQCAEAHLRARCPAGVNLAIRTGHSGQPYVTDPHSPAGEAAQRALRETFGDAEPALIREGGSIPIVQTFKELLGVETLLLGLALPDSRVHSPNENFPLENFYIGIDLNRILLRELAKGV